MDNDKPDAKKMPIGLLMSLAQHENAMENFSRLNDVQRENLLRFTTGSATGEEAQDRIYTAVKKLDENNTGFLD